MNEKLTIENIMLRILIPDAFMAPYRQELEHHEIEEEKLKYIPEEEVERAIEELGTKPDSFIAGILKDDTVFMKDDSFVYLMLVIPEGRKLNGDLSMVFDYVLRLCTAYGEWPDKLFPLIFNYS